MKEEETRERFIELRAEGLSYEKISKELKVSKPTLIEWSRTMATELHNAKTIRKEALIEKYALQQENRLNLFGSLLKKIQCELER